MGSLRPQALFLPLFYVLLNALYVLAQADGDGEGDANPNGLALTAPSMIEFCSTVDLTWTAGSPLYEVYFARGTGAIGDDSALGAERQLTESDKASFSWHVTSLWSELARARLPF